MTETGTPTGRIVTSFGFSTTAEEVVRGIDCTGKRVIVTGGASGIGAETARTLAGAGAEVTLAVRRIDSGEQVAAAIRQATGNPELFVRQLDLADQSSVQAFVATWTGPLHVLINNAGIMAVPTLERTPEGWELQLATNFVGHFALTIGLHPALEAARGARIVSVSSAAHLFSPVVFDDLHYDFRPYDPFGAYGQSKTADILLAVEATRLWRNDGILANALNPGAIPTNLQKYTGSMKTPPERRKTPQQGAATSVLLAVSPLLDGVGGRYFEDCNEAAPATQRPTDFAHGVAPYALDLANAERLWKVALDMVDEVAP
jgi:NAD(P)-dependent dehydrogenase (short-subunit alcohol dehydrogenase family)